MRWKHDQPRLSVPFASCLLIFDVSSFNLDYPKKSLENLYRQVGHWLAIDKKVTRRTAVMCNIGPDMCTLCSSAACAGPMQHWHWHGLFNSCTLDPSCRWMTRLDKYISQTILLASKSTSFIAIGCWLMDDGGVGRCCFWSFVPVYR